MAMVEPDFGRDAEKKGRIERMRQGTLPDDDCLRQRPLYLIWF